MCNMSVLWVAFGFGFLVGVGPFWVWIDSLGLAGLAWRIGVDLVCRGCCGCGLLAPAGFGGVFW